jgi:hypothetical protein
MDGHEGIEAGLLGLAQGSRHPRIERLMDLGTHMTHDAVERLKRRELKALLNQMLNRDINQVSRVAHGIGSLGDTLRHQRRATVGVRRDGQIVANEVPIARAQILRRVELGLKGQVELLAYILTDVEGNRVEGG